MIVRRTTSGWIGRVINTNPFHVIRLCGPNGGRSDGKLFEGQQELYEPAELPESYQPKIVQPDPQRRFQSEFAVGDEVSVIRHEHGWTDGLVVGRITAIDDVRNVATVVGLNDPGEYEIRHPRDIRLV